MKKIELVLTVTQRRMDASVFLKRERVCVGLYNVGVACVRL